MAGTHTIQVARDTAANWASANRTPVNGEPCFETDTDRWKIGDGSTAYNSLPYMGGPFSASGLSLIALVGAADKFGYFNGSGTAALTDLTTAARTLLDDTTVAAMRATLLVDPPAVQYVAADLDGVVTFDTNTTLANLTGIALTLPTAGLYQVSGFLRYDAANVAVGLKLGFTLTNFDEAVVRVELNGDGTTFVNGLIVASGGSVSETATPAGGQSVAHFRGYVVTSAINGVLQLQGARNTDVGDHTVQPKHCVMRAQFISA